MRRATVIFLVLWLNIFGLTFTTLFFYDYDPTVVFVEIQEEKSEDGSFEDDHDFLKSDEWNELITAHVFLPENTDFNYTWFIHSSTHQGYLLDLIKPPLARS